MATWTSTINKTASTWSNKTKTIVETIYFVAENLDTYLMGSSSEDTLVTQDSVNFINKVKY